MNITTSAAAVIDEPIPNTPHKWLVFVHELRFPNPKITAATQKALNGFPIIEAHAALSLLTLNERGIITPATKDVTAAGNRSIPLKVFLALCSKKHLSHFEPTGKRHHWRLRPESIPIIRSMRDRLAALATRATRSL